MAVRDYAGWRLLRTQNGVLVSTGVSLCVGKYPMRKRYALYVIRGGRSYPLAYFRSERHACEAMDLLEDFMRPVDVPERLIHDTSRVAREPDSVGSGA
jgi:hypothetical protein